MQSIDTTVKVNNSQPAQVTVVNTPSTAVGWSPADDFFGDTHSVHRTALYTRIRQAKRAAEAVRGALIGGVK